MSPQRLKQPAAKSGSLGSKAMLVRLTIKRWTGRRLDRKVTAEILKAKGAAPDAGAFNKSLVAKAALEKITSLACEARHFHYDNTLPWLDDGARLLPASHFTEYSKKLRAYQRDWAAVVNKFVSGYPSYVDDSRSRLNGMFDVKDYPAPPAIRERFGLDVVIEPVPEADDFRINLGNQETAKVRRSIEQRTRKATQDAMSDLWGRLHGAVAKIADRLGSADAIFRDSLIGNVRELTGVLSDLNITGDADLEKMRQQVEAQLAGLKPDDLRSDKSERRAAAATAKSIADKMGAFMGQKGETP